MGRGSPASGEAGRPARRVGGASRLSFPAAISIGVMLATKPASADDLLLHGEAAMVHAVADPQQREFGPGGEIAIAGELAFRHIIGVQAAVSVLALTDSAPPLDPAIANHGAGFSLGAMAGVRVHPFGARQTSGLWFDANLGVAVTGGAARPSVETHLGYDLRLGRGRLDCGPFLGYAQVFQPDDTLRPEDAHLVLLGFQVGLGAKAIPSPRAPRPDRDRDGVFDDVDACPDVPGVATRDPRTNGCPRGDRDGDTVFDDEDACPDLAGVRTDDRATNGCPRRDRDGDAVFDDEDACPDTAGVRTSDTHTNGCPRMDRDNDGVFDDEDACPDVPGVSTTDPKTNGCPVAGDQVRLVGDKIVLDEIIHFDTDSPRIRHPSWPLCKKVAEFIQANPDVLEIDIEGHADETGTDAHNLVLSRNRAEAVKRLLVTYGVESLRITTHAYGESRPKVAGHAEEQRKQNRRVEFTVTRARARPVELRPGAVPARSSGTDVTPPATSPSSASQGAPP